jgi:hypothetical protein
VKRFVRPAPPARAAWRGLGAALLVAALVVPAGSSSAAPDWEAVPGGWVSGPVQYVKTLPIDAGGGVGAVRSGKHLFVTTFRSFSIYDVSDPTDPQLLSTTPSPAHVFNEQPDTNGKVLILTRDYPDTTLEVWDVTDKAVPAKLADVPLSKPDHMWTCVLRCRYAYGGRGTIVDLRNPSVPQIVGDWTDGLVIERFHAIEEVAPGRVMTGTRPVFYLDGRKDPARPRVVLTQPLAEAPGSGPGLASVAPPPAFVDWPGNATDRFALVSTETPFSGPCSERSGSFATYDTRGWRRRHSFKEVDRFQISTPGGNYTEGRSPYDTWGCSAYAFDVAPDFAASRRVAVAWFENGVRLLGLDDRGKLAELGGFIPVGGSTSQPIWLDDSTLYLVDIYRGLDILTIGE